jgi:hypothetical protein
MMDMRIKTEDKDLKRLYKYKTLDINTQRLLKEGELYLSKPIDFNDPFDSYVDEIIEGNEDDFINYMKSKLKKDDSYIDKIISKIKRKEINFDDVLKKNTSQNYFNIFCMSRNYNNILMWSHYADAHKGICVGFNISHIDENSLAIKCRDGYLEKTKTKGLNYLPIYHVVYNIEKPKPYNIIKDNHQKIRDFMYSKSIDWQYEEEYRVVLNDEILLKNPVKIELTEIKEIIFGLKMSDSNRIMIKEIMKDILKNIEIYEMIKVDGKYKIEKQRIY